MAGILAGLVPQVALATEYVYGTSGDDTIYIGDWVCITPTPPYLVNHGVKARVNGTNQTVSLTSGEALYVSGSGGNDDIEIVNSVRGSIDYGHCDLQVISSVSVGTITIQGQTGEDVIYGSDWSDVIVGGSDRDLIWGYAGNDSLSGSAGNDEIYGGDGDDFIEGDEDNDELNGGAGNDDIIGGDADGFQFSYCMLGDDQCYGDSGADVIFCTTMIDGGGGTDECLDVPSSSLPEFGPYNCESGYIPYHESYCYLGG